MWKRKQRVLTVTSLTMLAFVFGCPFRHEEINVARDGSVKMTVHFEGAEEELAAFDAVPTKEAGWVVERRVEKSKKDEEKDKHFLEAVRSFGPGEALPKNFAAPEQKDAELVLNFPTDFRREKRADGTYFTFRRVYTPRAWAQTDFWRECFIDDDIKKLTEKGVETLTNEERTKVIVALVAVEAHKQAEFAQSAMAQIAADAMPETWLKARTALLNVYDVDRVKYDALVEKCEAAPAAERSSCYDTETTALARRAQQAFVESLGRESGWGAGRIEAFEKAFEWAKHRHEITERLGGHAFKIELTLPGTIVAHNADRGEGDEATVAEGGSIEAGTETASFRWEFDGRAFRDRPYELIAVTRIPNDAER